MKKFSAALTIASVIILFIYGCNDSTKPAGDQSSVTATEEISFARVLPTNSNTTIISYAANGQDTLFTYITNYDTTIYIPVTYSIQRTDTVWHLKGQTPSNLAPIVSAGNTQTITLPTNSVTLSGTATDPDGSISNVSWSKISGNGGTITTPAQNSTTVTGLTAGSYMYQFSATDNGGLVATASVIVNVNPAVVISLGIQGFGADVTGGSASSTVYHVTNMNASGSGSLVNGLGSNRTIVFDVSGTIKARINVSGLSNLTIDAYTSKQDITIDGAGLNAGDGINVENSSNILIRGLRTINCSNDGMNATGNSRNVVFDHCSSYLNKDGNIDLAATGSSGKNFTVQWCIMGNNQGSGNMLVTTQNASVHHNLFIGDGKAPEGQERDPYAHSNYSPVGTPPNLDFRNNLVNASGRYASGNGYKAVANYVNNYYTSNKAGLINFCADNTSCGFGYVAGNYNQPSATPAANQKPEYLIPDKYKITMTDAKSAANAVLQSAGPYKRSPYEQQKIDAIIIQ